MKDRRSPAWGFWINSSFVVLTGTIIILLVLGVRIPHANRFERFACSWCGKEKSTYKRWVLSIKTHEETSETDTSISKVFNPDASLNCEHDYQQVYIDFHQYGWSTGLTGSGASGGQEMLRSQVLAQELLSVRKTNAPLARQMWHDILLAANQKRAYQMPELEWLFLEHEPPQPFSVWYESNRTALRGIRSGMQK